MTPGQIALVKDSWHHVKPNADSVAGLFYARLFELDPALRALFKKDMATQGRMLTSVIDLAVSRLDGLDELLPIVRDMGRRHVSYGVQDQHYATVGAALMDTLATGLGSAFTGEMKAAWAAFYNVIASTMKSGAAQTSAAGMATA